MKLAPTHLAARKYMRRSQSLTPGVQTSSSFSVTESKLGVGSGCSSGSLAYTRASKHIHIYVLIQTHKKYEYYRYKSTCV